jgi:hypothetical protein
MYVYVGMHCISVVCRYLRKASVIREKKDPTVYFKILFTIYTYVVTITTKLVEHLGVIQALQGKYISS